LWYLLLFTTAWKSIFTFLREWFLLSELHARLRVMHVGVENLERSILVVASLWSPSIHLLCLSGG
jgi:hypothetical protein